MNKLMLVAAVMIASVSAHASKARLSSLQNAKHLMDIRDAFDGEAEETVNYEAAIVEFGGSTGTPNAEGGFIRKMGDASLGFYVGKDSATFATSANALANAIGTSDDEDATLRSAVEQENPFIITYGSKAGDMAWGAGLFVASKDKKNASIDTNGEIFNGKIKEDVMGIYGGVNNGVWDAQLRLGLGGTFKANAIAGTTIAAIGTAGEIKGTSTMNMKLSGGYKMDTIYYYGFYEGLASEAKGSGNASGTINGKFSEKEETNITVGMTNSHKKDGVDFFYGVAVESTYSKDKKTANSKVEGMNVPLLVGVEADATSWMTLRGAIKQSVPFVSTTKTAGKTNTVDSSTTTTVGAGFKWGKATVDTVMGMGSSGAFTNANGGEIFTNASMTYTF